MKRRSFIGSAAAAFAGATLPFALVLAASASDAISSDVPAVSGTGKQVLLTRAEVQELRSSLRGPLLLRSDDGYDQARRVWNGAFDRRPALIARCAGAADVIQAVQFARAHDLLVAVRGGGHSLPGYSVCEGGLMIDLALMNGVQVDPLQRTARVAPGVLLGQFDREAQAFGLATTAGTVSHTGVAGLTLGGGVGRLARKYGMSIDNLLAADVVTADGKLVRANSEQNSDLFWAIRGGGGNFGVVTSFEFQLHTLGPRLLGGDLVFPFGAAREILGFIAEYAVEAADELWIDPIIECDANGARQLLVNLCHCGDLKTAELAIAPLRKFRKSLQDTIAPTSYVRLQTVHDVDSPHGRSYYMTGGSVRRLEPALIDHALQVMQQPGAELAKVSMTHHGGAISRVPADHTAFANRSGLHNVVLRAAWDNRDESEAKIAWGRKAWSGFEPFTKGLYANLNLPDAQPRARGAYGTNLERLIELKTRYDPTNLFRMNTNIEPRSGAA